MLITTIVALALAQAPATHATKGAAAELQPIKIAAPELSTLNLDAAAATFYSEHVAQQLQLAGLRVTTSKEIATLLGFERQKALLQCEESSASCVAELANALGVDGILVGDIGKFGNKYQINVKILNAQDARVLTQYSGRVEGDEALLDELTRAAGWMAPDLAKKMGRKLVQTAQLEKAAPVPPWGWISTASGAVLAGAGAFCLSQAADRYQKLVGATTQMPVAQGQTLRSEGILFQRLGWAGVGVGVAAIGGGITMLALAQRPGQGAPPAIQASVFASPNQVVFSFSGVLP